MEHLSCFVPGMLALGAMSGEASLVPHLELAKELMGTCVSMYTSTHFSMRSCVVRKKVINSLFIEKGVNKYIIQYCL